MFVHSYIWNIFRQISNFETSHQHLYQSWTGLMFNMFTHSKIYIVATSKKYFYKIVLLIVYNGIGPYELELVCN